MVVSFVTTFSTIYGVFSELSLFWAVIVGHLLLFFFFFGKKYARSPCPGLPYTINNIAHRKVVNSIYIVSSINGTVAAMYYFKVGNARGSAF